MPVGYVLASESGETVPEHAADTSAREAAMLCAFVQKNRSNASVTLYSYNTELIRIIGTICEKITAGTASSFKIISFEKLTDALLVLKSNMTPLPDGRVVLGIDGYGSLELTVDRDNTSVKRTDDAACLTLDSLTMSRFMFGILPPELIAEMPREASSLLGAWFPLPLSWNGQDRM